MIPFLKYRFIYFAISAAVLIPGMYALAVWGLRPAIDFTGGQLIEFQFPTKSERSTVERVLTEKNIAFSSLQSSGDTNFLIRGKTFESSTAALLQSSLASASGQLPQIARNETVGPTIGAELLRKTLIAAIITVAMILLYVAYAFKNITYGVAAVVALLHDTLVLVGVFALLGHFKGVEVDALFVTALLTVMSFSVHDTIVVFDRIRSSLKENTKQPLVTVVNKALSETIVRSVNNSLTIVFMLLALFLLGGTTTRWFMAALLVGTISGTYSSPCIATPVLYEILKRKK